MPLFEPQTPLSCRAIVNALKPDTKKDIVGDGVWDFIVRRGDGVAHRVHPSLTNTKVGYQRIDNDDSFLTVHSARGRGLSDGSGTYRSFVNASYDSIGHDTRDGKVIRLSFGGWAKAMVTMAVVTVQANAQTEIVLHEKKCDDNTSVYLMMLVTILACLVTAMALRVRGQVQKPMKTMMTQSPMRYKFYYKQPRYVLLSHDLHGAW